MVPVCATGDRPSDSETVERFHAKLREEGVRIEPQVMRRCLSNLWSGVFYAISAVAQPGDARMVWQDALVFLGSRTRAAFEDQAHLSTGEPWISGCVTLLTAVDLVSGELLVIKLLPRHEERYRLSAEGEKGALEDLQLNTFPLEGPLVRMELVKVVLEGDSARTGEVGPRECEALKMRRFVSVLSELPQLSDKLIYEGGLRLVDALERMHAAGRVHCDVKGPNVLLTESGHWYLGDYGASVKVGETVWSCTEVSVSILLAERVILSMGSQAVICMQSQLKQ